MSNFSTKTQHNDASRSEDVPFDFDEIFFSRTDAKGIIQSGNSVFQRVSAYDWHELLHRPHNLIRHPDMPKAVFWLLWDTIKKGAPIGAYVKNKAKDGRYYWVFAIVTPIEEGFLSVRLKPSSTLFDTIMKEYASLRSMEIENKINAEESATLLLSRLQELGFNDYSTFMSAALSQEIVARDIKRNHEKDSCIAHFETLVSLSQDLLGHIEDIFRAYRESKYVPINLQAHAAQLGDSGAPISIIASNYTAISTEAEDSMKLIMDFGQQVAKTISDGLFLIGTARIQKEILDSFKDEISSGDASHEQEIAYLEQQKDTYSQNAIRGLETISSKVARFQQTCAGMRKLALGLEITCMMGKIESARLNTLDNNLTSLIGDLDAFQTTILSSLNEMYQVNQAVQLTIDRSVKNNMNV